MASFSVNRIVGGVFCLGGSILLSLCLFASSGDAAPQSPPETPLATEASAVADKDIHEGVPSGNDWREHITPVGEGSLSYLEFEGIASIPIICTQDAPEETPQQEPEPVMEGDSTSNLEEPTLPFAEALSVSEQIQQRLGMLGRWCVPEADIDVAVFDSASQETVDAWDSAAYFYKRGSYIIGDHCDEGFSTLSRCSVGMKAYLETADAIYSYTCTRIIYGHNTAEDLTDEEYNTVLGLSDEIICYTCHNGWQNVIIVFFAQD